MSEPLLLNNNKYNEKPSRSNSINSVVSNYSIKGNLELFEAIENEDDYKIRKILSTNPKAKIWTYLEDNQYTILHRLAFRHINSQNFKFFNIVRDILSFVTAQFKEKEKNTEFTKFINFKTTQGYTAMHYAAFRGNIFLIELFHEYNGDINCLNKRQLSIVHLAAQGNSPMTLCYIKQKNQSLFYSDKSLTGIDLLSESSKQLTVMKSPLSIEAPDQIESTPLHWACYSGSENVVTFLLSWKANPNSVDKEGLTPMHLAVLSEKVRIVKKLLHYGADKSIRDKKNRTPYDIAADKKHKALMEILKEDKRSCYFCVVKAPNQKIQKSLFNVIMFFMFNFFSFLCTFIIFLRVIESDVGIYSIIYYSFVGVIMLIYLILLTINSRAKRPAKAQQEYDECINDAIKNNKYSDISNFCPICFIKKEKNMRHCFICDECIDGFDHHCYWINKCVGKKNYWLFSIFIICLTFYLGYCMFLFIKLIISLKSKDITQCIFYPFFKDFLNNNPYIIWILGSINGLLVVLFLFPVAFLLCLHARNIIYNCRHRND